MLLRKSRSPADYTAALDTAVWIVQLRWFAVIGQCVAIAIAAGLLKLHLPLGSLAATVTITVFTNAALMAYLIWERKKAFERPATYDAVPVEFTNAGPVQPPINHDAVRKVSALENLLGTSLLTDVVTLTAMLYFSGGISNPFSCFYFANIAVCGLILAPRWTWAVSGLSVVGITFLLIRSIPLELDELEIETVLPFLSIRKQGSFVALATCCIVVTYFINVLMAELRNREERLAKAEAERTKSQRLEALATLAAGAGHELASPLSTIAVVAKELSRKLDKPDVPKSVTRDVELIRSELERCKEVLHRLKSGAGEASAEGFHEVTAAELAQAIVQPLRHPERISVVWREADKQAAAKLPLQALSQAIRNLLQNALDASPDSAVVQLAFELSPTLWKIRVIDSGSGMDQETVERIGQPFFTTKAVGKGMGLGVFLTRNVIQGLRGGLEITSQIGVGTQMTITIPV